MTNATRAERPTDIGARGWMAALKRSWGEAERDNVSIVAAGVAFYAFLAFIPLLAALVLTYGLVADPASVMEHVRTLTDMMPAEAAKLIGGQLMGLSESASGKKGFGLLLALLLSLYGAMRGAGAVITALNIVYNVTEERSFVRRTALALLITVGALLAMLLAILGISALSWAEAVLPTASPVAHFLVKAIAWAAAALAVSAMIAIVYRHAPNRPDAPWRWLTPGSLAATVLWLLATLGFGFYVSNFGNYNATYGSLGAVIVFLTWLYLVAYILLMGGELNAELEKQAQSISPER